LEGNAKRGVNEDACFSDIDAIGCGGPDLVLPRVPGTEHGVALEGDVTPRHFNVLFLCTGNSARSIMAEAILNEKGRPNFTGYSAGSHPTGYVHAEALRQIESAHMPTRGLHSESWDEFAKPDAPKIHFVFTVCDRAASEVCPVWPGHPLVARWGVPDPAAVQGTREQVERAFFEAFSILDRRITLFLSLPLATLEQEVVQSEIDGIGRL